MTGQPCRLEVIQRLKERRLNQTEAARALNISPRQAQRLLASFNHQGPQGLISQRRGKTSNHQLPTTLKNEALKLIQTHYYGF
jgi:molybdenum-dependent DNA-binding transcriptional regulator ModE